jgi:hypothetical protein
MRRIFFEWLMENELRFWVILILVLFFVAAILVPHARGEEYRVYPGGKPLLPEYVVKPDGFGNYSVYKADQLIVPKYVVKPNPDGSYNVYPGGKPVLPDHKVNSPGGVK